MTVRKGKVVFFTGSQNLSGGTERACADVSNLLLGSVSSLVILSQYAGLKSAYPVDDEIELIELFEKRPQGVLGALRTMLKLFLETRKNRPEFLIFVESISFIYALPLLLLVKRPILVNWEHFNAQTSLGRRSRRIARWLASHFSDQIIVLSDADKKIWQKKYPASISKLVRIFNVNPYDSNRSVLEKSLCVNRKASLRRVLAAGRLTHQKGFDLLLDAWASIPADIRRGWQLKIVGEGEDRALLEKKISILGFGSEVLLEGHSDDMAIEFSDAELFVLSSRFEGFGLVVVEALSFGLPVVSFDCVAGPGEILSNNENGILVSPENVGELAEALSKLLADESLRHRMATNTDVGLDRFSRNEIQNQWLSLLGRKSEAFD